MEKQRDDVVVTEADLTAIKVEGGKITEHGVRTNISVAIHYINMWLNGTGAVAINNLMEDAATAEISRAQLWQWIYHKCKLEDGRTLTEELFKSLMTEELEKLGGPEKQKNREAAKIVEDLVVSVDFEDFLTMPAYDLLIKL